MSNDQNKYRVEPAPPGFKTVAWRIRYPGAGLSRITENQSELVVAREMGAFITPMFERVA